MIKKKLKLIKNRKIKPGVCRKCGCTENDTCYVAEIFSVCDIGRSKELTFWSPPKFTRDLRIPFVYLIKTRKKGIKLKYINKRKKLRKFKRKFKKPGMSLETYLYLYFLKKL